MICPMWQLWQNIMEYMDFAIIITGLRTEKSYLKNQLKICYAVLKLIFCFTFVGQMKTAVQIGMVETVKLSWSKVIYKGLLIIFIWIIWLESQCDY